LGCGGEDEPRVPQELIALEHVVLLPHVGSGSAQPIAQGCPLEALIAEAIEDYLRKNAMPPAPTS